MSDNADRGVLPEGYDTPFVRGLIAEHGAQDVVIGLSWRGRPTVTLWSGRREIGPDGHQRVTDIWHTDGASARSEERPCVGCGLIAEDGEAPDPCLGWIDGVKAACCGHGVEGGDVYVWFGGDDVLRGEDALTWFADRGIGPDQEARRG